MVRRFSSHYRRNKVKDVVYADLYFTTRNFTPEYHILPVETTLYLSHTL